MRMARFRVAVFRIGNAIVILATTVTVIPRTARASYIQTNLASDGFVSAAHLDPNLVNPWGIAFSATSPIWISDQGANLATIYNGSGTPQSLVVSIPGSSTPPSGPTGQVFNSAGGTNFQIGAPGGGMVTSTFLFDTLQGTIDGWNPGSSSGAGAAEIAVTQPGAVFTGLALDSSGGNNYLYAADSKSGVVDVYNSTFANVTATTFAGKFVDPSPIAGFVPFNVQNIDGDLYVEYAMLTPTGQPLPGGYVDVYDASGNFIQRLATNGALEAPWGITLAPASGFGPFSGDLLIGNFGNGQINAFNPTTGAYIATLDNANGTPITNSFLWALDFGNGAQGTSTDTLYFTAGLNNQHDGLFGAISFVPEPGTLGIVLLGLAMLALGSFRRFTRSGRRPLFPRQ